MILLRNLVAAAQLAAGLPRGTRWKEFALLCRLQSQAFRSEMLDDVINWMGSRACEGLAAMGISRTCSSTDSIFGMGLISFAVVFAFALVVAIFARRSSADGS